MGSVREEGSTIIDVCIALFAAWVYVVQVGDGSASEASVVLLPCSDRVSLPLTFRSDRLNPVGLC